MPEKKTIVFVIPSDVIAKTFSPKGTLSDLISDFNIHFILAPEVSESLHSPAKKIFLSSLHSNFKKKLDLHFWYFSLYTYMRRQGINSTSSFKAAQLKPFYQKLYSLLSQPGFAWLNFFLDSKVFFKYDSNIKKHLEQLSPDLVITPGSAIDSYSHLVLRTAKKINIPTLMIVSHWDFFSKKGLLRINPDKVYVWGDDMKSLALTNKSTLTNTIKVVGSPKFDKYINNEKQDRKKNKRKHNLPEDAKVLLFAGTATPFDEISVIKRIHTVLKEYENTNIYILYRPHPRAWSRKQAGEININTLEKVIIDDINKPSASSSGHFQELMSVISGVISPFSTMILEAALCSKPAFCVSFSDEVNNWDFAEAQNTEHIKVLKGRRWLSVCNNSADLESDFIKFLDKLNENNLKQVIEEDIKKTIYYNSTTYSKRLRERIRQDYGL